MDHLTEIGNLISESSIFKKIPEEGLREIVRIAERKLVPAHTIIFRQGDPGDSLYIINSGAVRVYRKTSKGMETELTVLRDGGHFGELALLTDKPRAGYAETVEESDLVVISKDHLENVLREYPHISSVLINCQAGSYKAMSNSRKNVSDRPGGSAGHCLTI